jgi:hypothetical protein
LICSCSGRDVFARYHGRNTFGTRYDVADEWLLSETPSVPFGSSKRLTRHPSTVSVARSSERTIVQALKASAIEIKILIVTAAFPAGTEPVRIELCKPAGPRNGPESLSPISFAKRLGTEFGFAMRSDGFNSD